MMMQKLKLSDKTKCADQNKKNTNLTLRGKKIHNVLNKRNNQIINQDST